MHGFDVNQFLRERTEAWKRLERLLGQIEERGMRSLGIDGARNFGKLYRAVSADLIRARTELVDASVVDYLNDLVARSYAQIHAGRARRGQAMLRYFLVDYPRLVREEWRPIALAAGLLLGGGVLGAGLLAAEPSSQSVLIPEQHQAFTPEEHIAQERERGAHSGDTAAAFSSFLFTHNIQVTFLVFAAGLTYGVGTVLLLLSNGVPLGALAMQYHQAGEGTFFWAWILPHGIPELSSIFIAGGAGLILARGLARPGRRRRLTALREEGRRAAHLVVGTMPVLVLAGLIEGTISQLHDPIAPAWAKLSFAALVGTGLYAWLGLAGRRAAQ